jgi:hypothetical protein
MSILAIYISLNTSAFPLVYGCSARLRWVITGVCRPEPRYGRGSVLIARRSSIVR